MVHGSLRALGVTERRGEGVVASLLEALGSSGTLLSYVDYEITAEVPYFDPERSPAALDHGVLAELIRLWPGAVRSLNPGASVVGLGAKANFYCQDHPIQYGYGPNSPFAKLVASPGKVLLLGSHLDHVTLLHHAEHLANLPDKKIVRRRDWVLREGKKTPLDVEEFDTSVPVIEAMEESIFASTVSEFIQRYKVPAGPVGNARSYLLPAESLVNFAVETWEKKFGNP